MSEAMSALREAILALLSEQISMEGEASDEARALWNAWNDVCEASPTVGVPEPITVDDIEAMFE